MDNEKWLRRALHVAFLIVFAGVMYNSFSKLHARNTAFTQEQKTAPTLLYPSITMCPVLSSDQYRNGNYTLGLKMEDLIKGFFHTYEEGNKYESNSVIRTPFIVYLSFPENNIHCGKYFNFSTRNSLCGEEEQFCQKRSEMHHL